MSLKINYNASAIVANNSLKMSDNRLTASLERLSSGYKINHAKDNAAGLAIARRMNAQIEGLKQANNNANDGLSVVNTADGAMSEMHSILQRMNELATQAANDTNTETDREAIKAEIDQLVSEIDRIQSTTQFNTMNLLDGDFTGKNLQVGALSGQVIAISIGNMNADTLGVKSLSVDSNANAGTAMTAIQTAIEKVSTQRSDLGAIQNRLEHTIANLDTTSENTSAAESRIRDVDMAKEMVTYSKNNILAQAGQSMLAQANQANQGVLSLLQ